MYTTLFPLAIFFTFFPFHSEMGFSTCVVSRHLGEHGQKKFLVSPLVRNWKLKMFKRKGDYLEAEI